MSWDGAEVGRAQNTAFVRFPVAPDRTILPLLWPADQPYGDVGLDVSEGRRENLEGLHSSCVIDVVGHIGGRVGGPGGSRVCLECNGNS